MDVMLAAMEDAISRGDMPAAASFAKDAAPYMHPHLQAVVHIPAVKNPLEQLLEEIEGKQRRDPPTTLMPGWVKGWVASDQRDIYLC
ncbi:MAG: hypothetical protein ACKVP3_04040 [Hyphomicrobiaceae bacterium]